MCLALKRQVPENSVDGIHEMSANHKNLIGLRKHFSIGPKIVHPAHHATMSTHAIKHACQARADLQIHFCSHQFIHLCFSPRIPYLVAEDTERRKKDKEIIKT